MKNFKKAIAVLLAVLMVAFSVPFTAMAATISDNDYSAVVMKLYATSSDSKKILNPEDIKFDDLGDDHKITVYITTENLLAASTVGMCWYFDPAVLDAGDLIAGPSTTTTYVPSADDISTFGNEDGCNVSFSATEFDCSAQTESTYNGVTLPGIIWGVFELTVLQDDANITWDWYTTGNEEYGWESGGASFLDDTYPDSDPTFTFAYGYPSGGDVSTEVTYTFIDDKTPVTQAADEAAPANTVTYSSNGDGSHVKTTYQWVEDGNNFKETEDAKTTVNESCENYKAAVAPVHTATAQTPGTTASWNCSLCGSSQAETAVPVTHSYTDTVVAATCSAKGYTQHTCSVCGDSYKDNYTEGYDANNHVNTTDVDAVAATCIAGGYTAGVWCNDCQQYISGHEATGVDPNNHAEGCVPVTDEAVAPTCQTAGKTEGSHYSLCNKVIVAQETIPASADYHDWQVESSTDATCTVPGTVNYRCSICGETKQDTGVLDPTNHVNTTDVAAVAGTCVADGFTAGVYCNDCHTWVSGHENTGKDLTNHVGTTHTENAAAATCTAAGYTGDVVCDSCGNVVTAGTEIAIDPDNHTGEPVTDEAVAPTRANTGLTEGSHWSCCDAVINAQEVIPALGVNITVDGSDLGTVKVNDTVAGADAVNVPYGQAYTLTATPKNDNIVFVGWMMGGKLVSDAAEYTTAAFADTTYTAVFEDATTGTFDINFVDKFNNVLATYTNEQVAAWTAMPEIACPFDAFEISGYSMTLEEIQALTASANVNVEYTAKVVMYTVAAQAGVVITVDGNEIESGTTVAYDSKVTVTNADATVWYVNGKEAGFGTSYSFYVTSNVEVTFDTAAVEATPVVAPISADLQADGVKVRFLASRNVPANYKVVESGFVYGKEMAQDDLVLENVGKTAGTANAVVKLYKNSNTSNEGQFGMTYGVSAKTTASARAYLIVSLNGEVQPVIYADAQIYNY